MLLHQSTPEWTDWREKHVQSLPEMQAHTQVLEHRRRDAGAAEGWIQANYLRYLQVPRPWPLFRVCAYTLDYTAVSSRILIIPGAETDMRHRVGDDAAFT